MSKNATQELMTEVKEYLRLNSELIKVKTVIKISYLAASIIFITILIISLFITSILLTLAGVHLIKPIVGEAFAFAIGGGGYLILIVVIYLLRTPLIVSPIAKQTNKLINQ